MTVMEATAFLTVNNVSGSQTELSMHMCPDEISNWQKTEPWLKYSRNRYDPKRKQAENGSELNENGYKAEGK